MSVCWHHAVRNYLAQVLRGQIACSRCPRLPHCMAICKDFVAQQQLRLSTMLPQSSSFSAVAVRTKSRTPILPSSPPPSSLKRRETLFFFFKKKKFDSRIVSELPNVQPMNYFATRCGVTSQERGDASYCLRKCCGTHTKCVTLNAQVRCHLHDAWCCFIMFLFRSHLGFVFFWHFSRCFLDSSSRKSVWSFASLPSMRGCRRSRKGALLSCGGRLSDSPRTRVPAFGP